ncbi:hypothetical protein PISMIDRAFT_679324, partial [Pisolithus microcarpus 441]
SVASRSVSSVEFQISKRNQGHHFSPLATASISLNPGNATFSLSTGTPLTLLSLFLITTPSPSISSSSSSPPSSLPLLSPSPIDIDFGDVVLNRKGGSVIGGDGALDGGTETEPRVPNP